MERLLLALLLSLCGTPHTHTASGGVEWRERGGEITIHCSVPLSESYTYLHLKKGLREETSVVYIKGSEKTTEGAEFKGRLERGGAFPNVSVRITDLRDEDTGVYWCVYSEYNTVRSEPVYAKGAGSVMLVVKGNKPDPEGRSDSGSSNMNLILVFVITSAILLLLFLTLFLIWFIRKSRKSHHATANGLTRVATNEVYEDMRGTIRGGRRLA